MATKTYVFGSDQTAIAQNIAAALQPLVTAGYFDEITTNVTSDTATDVLGKIDEIAVVTIRINCIAYQNSNYYYIHILFHLNSGTDLTCVLGDQTNILNFNVVPKYVYTCSGGAYISMDRNDTTLQNVPSYQGVFIAKTNNDKIGVFLCGVWSSYSSGNKYNKVSTRLSDTYAWAQDDDASECATKYSFPAIQLRNQATLVNIPTSAAANNPSYFPDIVYTFTSQMGYADNNDSPPVEFEQDGEHYLWTGYYAIRDEVT